MLGSATLDDVKRRLLPKFVALSADEMYRVRKASGECLVDVSRALVMLPWRLHFRDVWIDEGDEDEEDATVAKTTKKKDGSGAEGTEDDEETMMNRRRRRKKKTINSLLRNHIIVNSTNSVPKHRSMHYSTPYMNVTRYDVGLSVPLPNDYWRIPINSSDMV